MASLTTVYTISMFLTSIAGIASAFLGNRIFPLTGGAQPVPKEEQPVPKEETFSSTASPQTPAEPPVVSENSPGQSL